MKEPTFEGKLLAPRKVKMIHILRYSTTARTHIFLNYFLTIAGEKFWISVEKANPYFLCSPTKLGPPDKVEGFGKYPERGSFDFGDRGFGLLAFTLGRLFFPSDPFALSSQKAI